MYQNLLINPSNFQSWTLANVIVDNQNFLSVQNLLRQQMALSLLRQNQLQSQLQSIYVPSMTHLLPISVPHILEPIKVEQMYKQPQTFTEPQNMMMIPENLTKIESDTLKLEEESLSSASLLQKHEEPEHHTNITSIRIQVSRMLYFFLNEFGKSTPEQILEQKPQFASSRVMQDLFDILLQKYSSTVKSKEDMSRFVLRKAITHLRDCLRRQLNLNAKTASVALCKKYFKHRVQEITKIKSQKLLFDPDKNTEILNFLLPYKKNSRNKTPNSCFIKEIFSSESFCHDYNEYVERFEEIMGEDNEKKIEKFVEFLVKCVKEKTISQVSGYKRLPWLKYWLESGKKVAQELLEANQECKKSKEIKKKVRKENCIFMKKEEP